MDIATAQSLYYGEYAATIQHMIRTNEVRCSDEDPDKMFLVALAEGIARGTIKLADSRKQFTDNSTEWFGFWENDNAVFNATQAYEFVTYYYNRLGLRFTESMKGLWALLRNKGYTDGYKEKNRLDRPLKEIQINGGELKILCLKWDLVVQTIAAMEIKEEDDI